MADIKNNKKGPKVSERSSENKSCEVPDFSVFFSFQYITSDKRYNYDYINKSGNKTIYKDIMSALQTYSQFSWEELGRKGKINGGYETLDYGIMVPSIASQIKGKPITKDTKLYVFRVGGKKYRMIGYKSNSCKAAMHILGFDFDCTLYDHGS